VLRHIVKVTLDRQTDRQTETHTDREGEKDRDR